MQAGRANFCAFVFVGGLLIAGASSRAQEFRPSQQELLYRSTIAGSSSSGFDRKDTVQKPAGAATNTKTKSAPSGATQASAKPPSISSELSSGHTSSTPNLKTPSAPAQRKPFDDKIPFGPLSLGLQAEGSPRSEALTTPSAPGAEQFKKDKFDPYVGFSIIDIKR